MTKNLRLTAAANTKTSTVPIKTAHSSERAALAAQQDELLAALMDQGEPPAAIDDTQIEATARSLFQKRARYISRCLPELGTDPTYVDNMKKYVIQHPGSHPEGICRDAARFADFCNKHDTSRATTATNIIEHFRNLAKGRNR